MSFKEQMEDKFPEFCENSAVECLLILIQNMEKSDMAGYIIDLIQMLNDYFKQWHDLFNKEEDFIAFNQLVSDYLG